MLPSGLRVVTEHLPGSQSHSLGFFVETGSRHESAKLHGVSHFLEHVLFKGTRRRSPEQISAEIEQVGGEINAYTAREHTCFYARVLDADAPIAADVLVDMMSNSVVRAEDVDFEREVILDEITMHDDDPAEVAHELVTARLFDGLSLGRSVIGSSSSITALTRNQIASYWKRHYRPSTVVVAAAGSVDHDALVEAVRPFDSLPRFAGDEPESSPRKGSAAPVLDGNPVLTRTRPTEQSIAVLGFPSPGVFTADGRIDQRRYALNLLATALGGGMSSRLFVQVRERRGLAYAIDAFEGAFSDVGTFCVEWGSTPERMPEILSLVEKCIADVVAHGITAEELERARGQVRGQLLLGFEGASARMSRLGSAEMMGDVRSIDDVLAAYDQVTGADVAAVAREFLTVRPVLAVVGPEVNRGKLRTRLDRWLSAER